MELSIRDSVVVAKLLNEISDIEAFVAGMDSEGFASSKWRRRPL